MQSYASRSCGLDELDESLAKDLTDVEKHLMGTQDLMSEREGMHSKKHDFSLPKKHA